MGLPKRIRMAREKKRLEGVAHERGYESCASMLHELYCVQGVTIEKIADDLVTPIYSLRKTFDDLGIEVKSRGGRNNVRVEITKELFHETCVDGLTAVADRIGIDRMTLHARLKSWLAEHPEELEAWTKSLQQED